MQTPPIRRMAHNQSAFRLIIAILRFSLVLALVVPLGAQFKDWPPMPQSAALQVIKGDLQGLVNDLRAHAEAGDTASMFWLGRSLEEVEGVPHDYAQAIRWYRKAFDAGVGVAAWSIGRLHEMGRGTLQDSEEAQRWYAKAAEMGFRRTALTHIQLRWFPGPESLQYEPRPVIPNFPPPPSPDMAFLHRPLPEVTPEELDELRKAGLGGRLVWQGGGPGMFGLPARVIFIAQRRVTDEVRLLLPVHGSIIYVQESDQWHAFGSAKLGDRSVRIHPQSAEIPWNTILTFEMEDGGIEGYSGWGWEHR